MDANLGPVAQVSVARSCRLIDTVPFYTADRVPITCGALYHKLNCAEANCRPSESRHRPSSTSASAHRWNYVWTQELLMQLENETNMPVILWLLGVPLVVVVLLMLAHVI